MDTFPNPPGDNKEGEEGDDVDDTDQAPVDPGADLMAVVVKELNSEDNIEHSDITLTVFPQVRARLPIDVVSRAIMSCNWATTIDPAIGLSIFSFVVQADQVHAKINDVILDAIVVVSAPPRLLTHPDLSPYTQVTYELAIIRRRRQLMSCVSVMATSLLVCVCARRCLRLLRTKRRRKRRKRITWLMPFALIRCSRRTASPFLAASTLRSRGRDLNASCNVYIGATSAFNVLTRETTLVYRYLCRFTTVAARNR